jgi:choline-glycine betaine transporter
VGAIAAILLLAGGLDALQNGAILAATPFAILMCLMCWCLYKTLQRDYREARKQVQEIMRRHEAREPIVPTSSSNSNK